MTLFRFAVLTTAVLHLAAAGPAYAYLDLGTGSYLFQLAIGFFVGGLFTLRMFGGRIKSWIGGLFGRSEKETDDDEERS